MSSEPDAAVAGYSSDASKKVRALPLTRLYSQMGSALDDVVADAAGMSAGVNVVLVQARAAMRTRYWPEKVGEMVGLPMA